VKERQNRVPELFSGGVEDLLTDFNILATTSRGNERLMVFELAYLLKEAGDPSPEVTKTGIRGLVAAKTSLNPIEVIEKFRKILKERSYEFRYSLRILPVEKVVHTDLDEIRNGSSELSARIGENETYRVTVEKRFTVIHTRDLIEATASNIQRKADMNNPDRILLIEVVGGWTGLSLIRPNDIIAVQKEKML
jgi:tRNA acetyltransferase TAN1